MSTPTPPGARYAFEEFSLYYQTTEKVTDRRHALNKWNYSLCVAIMTAIAGLAAWTLERPDFRLVMLCSVLVLAGMGTLLCDLWLRQIRDLKDLNNAKFDVLNMMAPLVEFAQNAHLTSARPFEQEWAILKKNEATKPVASMDIVALKSSDAEIFVPQSFRWLFILVAAIVLITISANWTELTTNLFDLGAA